MTQAKRVLLIVSGGIAAYKTLELIRRLKDDGIDVRCVLTEGGAQFVTPLSLSALSENPVHSDLFSLTEEAEMGHIRLSRESDLILIAPASADIMARMAGGHANDLATTVLLATDTPVMIAPAMNVRMWDHPATQANVATLKARGISIVGPDEGAMACGEFGPGRMVEPAAIRAAVLEALNSVPNTKQRLLTGLSALVTSGPTHEPIDPVRYIANRSSGKQGHAIAAALAALGADVRLVSGPTQLPDPPGVEVIRIETAQEMLEACQVSLPRDIAIFAAAVADWRVASRGASKIKKQDGGAPPALEMTENPDILKTISRLSEGRPRLVIGFAAETEDVVRLATEKRARKGCDWIVANDVSEATGTFGGDDNLVHLISDSGAEEWPRMTKGDVAATLANRVSEYLSTLK